MGKTPIVLGAMPSYWTRIKKGKVSCPPTLRVVPVPMSMSADLLDLRGPDNRYSTTSRGASAAEV